jgi:putative membrane protein
MNKMLIAAIAAVGLAGSALGAEPLSEAQFVSRATEASLAEVELGKLAAQKAEVAEVRAFAQRMVADHTKARAELDRIATAKGLRTVTELNVAHTMALDTLRTRSGRDFDTAFVKQMVTDHDEAVELFTAATQLSDKELAAFASRTLPVLQQHRQGVGHLAGH